MPQYWPSLGVPHSQGPVNPENFPDTQPGFGSVPGPQLKACYPSATKVTSGVSVNAGDLLIVAYDIGNSLGSPTIADSAAGGTNTYTQVGTGIQPSGGGISCNLWYAVANATEVLTVTVTDSNTNGPRCWVHVVSGCAATSVLDTYATTVESVAGTAHVTNSITTTQANDYVFTFWDQNGSGNLVDNAGSGFQRELSSTSGAAGTFDQVATVPGAYAQSATSPSSATYISFIAAFKQLVVVTAANATGNWTEDPDVVALQASVPVNAVGIWVEDPDVVSLQVTAPSASSNATLACVEDPDAVVLAANTVENTALAFTEGADTFSLQAEAPINGTLTFTEAADAVSLTLLDILDSSLAFTETVDTFSLQVTGTALPSLNSSMSYAEDADVVALAAQAFINGSLTFTEAADVVALLAQDQEGAWLAFVEAADAVSMQTVAFIGTVAQVQEDPDVVAGNASVAAGSVLQFTENPDAVLLWTDGGNPTYANISTVGMMANTGTLLFRS